MHRRLQISLTTLLAATQVRDSIKTKLVADDLWTDEDAIYSKNQEANVGKDMEDKDTFSATYLFKDSTKAESIFENLKKLTGITGLMSLHYCPEEGEIADWQGCKNDIRADYREVSF